MKFYIHILAALAFILTGISPACEFISGKATFHEIEICAFEGIKTIKVADEQAPKQDHKAKQDCGFCFAQSHLKLAKVPPQVFTAYAENTNYRISTGEGIHAARPELSVLSARAPPQLLS